MKITLHFPPLEIDVDELRIGDRQYLMVDAEALQRMGALLPRRRGRPPGSRNGSAEAETTPATPRAAAKAEKKPTTRTSREKRAPQAAKPEANGEGSPLVQQITALLAKDPLTSADIIHRTGKTPASIYTVLSAMRKDGVIETRESDSGERVNALVVKPVGRMHAGASL